MTAAVDALTATYGTQYTYGNTAVTICKIATFLMICH